MRHVQGSNIKALQRYHADLSDPVFEGASINPLTIIASWYSLVKHQLYN